MHVGWLSTLLLPDGSEALDAACVGSADRGATAPRAAIPPASCVLAGGRARRGLTIPAFRLERHVTEVARRAADAGSAGRDRRSVPLGAARPLEAALGDRGGAAPGRRPARSDHRQGPPRDGRRDRRGRAGDAPVRPRADAALPDRVDWEPERAAGPLQLAAGSVVDGAVEQFRAARRVAALGHDAAPHGANRGDDAPRGAAGRRGRGAAGASVVPQSRDRPEAGAGLRADAGRAPAADQGRAGREAERRRPGRRLGRLAPVRRTSMARRRSRCGRWCR